MVSQFVFFHFFILAARNLIFVFSSERNHDGVHVVDGCGQRGRGGGGDTTPRRDVGDRRVHRHAAWGNASGAFVGVGGGEQGDDYVTYTLYIYV